LPVSENDAIFCILLYWNAKNGIIFAYKFVPFNSSNWGRGELQFFAYGFVWRPAAASGKIEVAKNGIVFSIFNFKEIEN